MSFFPEVAGSEDGGGPWHKDSRLSLDYDLWLNSCFHLVFTVIVYRGFTELFSDMSLFLHFCCCHIIVFHLFVNYKTTFAALEKPKPKYIVNSTKE